MSDSHSKILIIDDDELPAQLLALSLQKKAKFKTVILTNSQQSLQQVKEHKPDLVLLDYQMPLVSGLECLTTIRTEFKKDELPIIMLTSHDASDTIVKCFESGANDYIVKGSPISVVISRIMAHSSVASLVKEKIRLKELQAVMSLIVSYNHEINNPLAIALGYLEICKNSLEQEKYEKIHTALHRIELVVKSLKKVGEKSQLEFEEPTLSTPDPALKLK
jgi:DNA-binding response OmpR family regulator